MAKKPMTHDDRQSKKRAKLLRATIAKMPTYYVMLDPHGSSSLFEIAQSGTANEIIKIIQQTVGSAPSWPDVLVAEIIHLRLKLSNRNLNADYDAISSTQE